MRKIVCYIATSLDGKIADAHDGIEWLDEIPNPEKSDYGYNEFIKSIDCILMGNKTYQKVVGFDMEFPYKTTKNYVITRNASLIEDKYATYISSKAEEFISQLKNSPGKNIWCMGGGGLIGFLLNHQLLDELIIFIMPTVLGPGIPMITDLQKQYNLELISSKSYKSGVIELRYKVLSE